MPNHLATWDDTRQQQYRAACPQEALQFHILLDASPSMVHHKDALLRSYNLYQAWLQQHASPMAMADVHLFSETLTRGNLEPIGLLPRLTPHTYQPQKGDGTALYNAIGTVCSTAAQKGQHVLIVFTDGEDCARDLTWSAARVGELLTTLQDHAGWLCVYLAAYREGMAEARAMGFRHGNILCFDIDRIPEAFADLTTATARYLSATVAERKLLAQAIF